MLLWEGAEHPCLADGGGNVWDGACAQVGLLSLAGSQEDAEGNISVAACV